MRVCICDDIVEYRISIRSYVEQFFKERNTEYQIDEYSNPEELLAAKDVRQYDVFFIDIEFDENKNGIDLIRILQKNCNNSFFIVVTAYNQYLDTAMDLNVLRFIDKPIKQERIVSALERAIDVIYNSVLEISSTDGSIYRIKKQNIIFAEACMRKSKFITTERKFVCPLPFKKVKEILTSTEFLIPHSSFVVNKNYIASLNRTNVVLKYNNDVYNIPIAATKQKTFKSQFNR